MPEMSITEIAMEIDDLSVDLNCNRLAELAALLSEFEPPVLSTPYAMNDIELNNANYVNTLSLNAGGITMTSPGSSFYISHNL